MNEIGVTEKCYKDNQREEGRELGPGQGRWKTLRTTSIRRRKKADDN